MEFAIPLVFLGGLYISSNDKKKKGNIMNEGYTNMKNHSYLPNTDIPCENYPKTVVNKLGPDSIMQYQNGRAPLDKYYDNNVYSREANKGQRTGSELQEHYSLTGEVIDKSNFKHNNMVPFFGGKMRGVTCEPESNESRLDNMQGMGSQHIKKVEQAPLFAPQESFNYAYGAPNNNDFYQSRVNPSNRMANIKPWAEEKVAPGLNLGYGTQGSNGFNNGMEAQSAWLPKSVNELRVATNPKVSYTLDNHEGPAIANVKNMGILGQVEKNRPDRAFEWGPSRYFTTTGVEKAQRVREEQMLNPVNRTETTTSYYGVAGNAEGKTTYTTGTYEDSKKIQLGQTGLAPASAIGKAVPTTGDYGVKGYKMLPNNRATTSSNTFLGGVNGIMKAAVAPIMDVIKPTRKQNVIGNARPNGNVGVTAPASRVYNPADRTKTTNREMTGDKLDCNHLNVQNQNEGAYKVTKQTPVQNQRDTTSIHYIGNGAASNLGQRTYDAEYRQRNNVNKTYESRPNMGGTQIFNQFTNIAVNKRDNDRNNNRYNMITGGANATPSIETYGSLQGGRMTTNEGATYNMNRIDPGLLSAFKENPYTKPFEAVA